MLLRNININCVSNGGGELGAIAELHANFSPIRMRPRRRTLAGIRSVASGRVRLRSGRPDPIRAVRRRGSLAADRPPSELTGRPAGPNRTLNRNRSLPEAGCQPADERSSILPRRLVCARRRCTCRRRLLAARVCPIAAGHLDILYSGRYGAQGQQNLSAAPRPLTTGCVLFVCGLALGAAGAAR